MTFMWGLTIGVAFVAGGAAWVASATSHHTFRWKEESPVPEGCLRTGAEWALRTIDTVQHALQKSSRVTNKFIGLGAALARDSACVIQHRHKHSSSKPSSSKSSSSTSSSSTSSSSTSSGEMKAVAPSVTLDDDDLAP